MKRHEALAPLSREHHGALILARLVQKNAPAYKGLPTLPAEKAVYAVNYFKTALQNHFLKEEEMLSKVKKYSNKIDELSSEISKEHQQLIYLFTSLEKSENLTTSLDNLGKALENHIRKEERILFPLIQEHCPKVILDVLEL